VFHWIYTSSVAQENGMMLVYDVVVLARYLVEELAMPAVRVCSSVV